MALLFRALLYFASLPGRDSAFRLTRGIAWLLSKSEAAEVTEINLQACFPEWQKEPLERVSRQSLRHMVMLFFEMAQLRFWPTSRLLNNIEVFDQHVLDAARAEGQGLILLVPHLGNWEIMSTYLGHHYSLAALYDPPKVSGLETEIKAARERFAGKMFAIGVGGMRNILKELKGGGLVAILPDQVPERDAGVYAPFFDRPALTMTLPLQLQRRTNAAMVLACVTRKMDADGRMLGYALNFRKVADTKTPEAFAKEVNLLIEREVRRSPAQYQWDYKRFKRPPGRERNIYRRQ